MSSKRRYLIFMLILWLPLQGLAAGLLHCDTPPAQAAADEHSSPHQHHAPVSAEVDHEHHSSASDDTSHQHGSHKYSDLQHAEPCQQCCQVCTTLIPSHALTASPALATPVIWHIESADSFISDPLFHPPQSLS
ncbi:MULTISPECIES: hypothetical protein [unclassified Marinobacter]|jgi:hypothetical protein|uniref:hypothetical protein n=1 Tax=unclassified Marinobacter TaxID=83889 RepID=UPI0012695DA5|nr:MULTISPECIES: hypothetical protein [unclassified Marinobacter]